MEKGTQVVGEYRGNVRRGSKRMFVLWTRAKTPTGVIVALASPATDALAAPALTATSTPISGSDSVQRCCCRSSTTPPRSGASSCKTARSRINNTTGATNTAAGIAVEQSINIPPTLNKNQGELVNIFVARDVDFSSVYQLNGSKPAPRFSTAPCPEPLLGRLW